jgi:alkylation response protein AidB-like acyl-CoA dehydrogenase
MFLLARTDPDAKKQEGISFFLLDSHIGSPKMPEYGLTVLETVARARDLWDDPAFREKYATLKLDVVHLADAYNHFTGIVVRGEPLGQNVSYLKIWATETFERIADLVIETAGPFAAINGEAEVTGVRVDVLASFYKARPPTIYGGSNEIQRNVIAQQVLGPPRR